jgi:hypothetical protein
MIFDFRQNYLKVFFYLFLLQNFCVEQKAIGKKETAGLMKEISKLMNSPTIIHKSKIDSHNKDKIKDILLPSLVLMMPSDFHFSKNLTPEEEKIFRKHKLNLEVFLNKVLINHLIDRDHNTTEKTDDPMKVFKWG